MCNNLLGEKGGGWMKWQTGEEKVKQKQRRIEQNVKKSKKAKDTICRTFPKILQEGREEA